jgi:regulation of enolase protein 1 (concanavalin A-like superfamily)
MARTWWIAFVALLVSSAAQAGEKTRVLPGWGAVTDPDGDCRFKDSRERLVISVPGGMHDLDPRPEYKINGPRVLQEVEGDFTILVRVAGAILPDKNTALPGKKVPFRAASLLVWQDAKHFIRLDRAGMVKDDKPLPFAYFHFYKDGKLASEQGPALRDEAVLLRLERKGERFSATAQQDKAVKKLPTVTWRAPAKLLVGVGAVNVSTQELHAVFEDLKITK